MPGPSSSFTQRFGGIARLYGHSALERFRTAHVAVVGIGGVGSWAAEALARSGIGTLTLVDLDELCLTNTNRQVHAVDGQVGRSKVRVMAERLATINPEAAVHPREEFYSEKNSDRILDGAFDAVIDAIDVVRPKCHLLAACALRGLPVVSCGGAGGRRDPARIAVADLSRTHGDALLGQARKQLRSDYGFPSGEGKARGFGIPAVFSDEAPVYPDADGCVSAIRPADLPPGLRCDAGYGTATHITATFGLFAVGEVLDTLAS